MRRSYLVTGGSGYFGSLLVARLATPGNRVRVLDLNDASDRPPDVEFVRGDVRDKAIVRGAVEGIDVVMNNVAQVPLARDAELLRTVNVDGTANLLGASAAAGVAKVIHTSSSAVFGVPKSNPVMPTTVPSPMEAYGHAKLAAEWACLAAARDGLDVSIVRPRTILGHGRLGIFGILFDWIADGYDPIVLGDGTNRYQFVHSDDLAEACVRAAATEGPDIFNVGTDRFGTMRETLADLCEHAGTGATVRSLPAGPAALGMRLSAAARHLAVRAVPLDDVLEVDVVRPRSPADGASRGARPGRPPTCSPRATTGSSPIGRRSTMPAPRITGAAPAKACCRS